jgi:hypothetical protein
MGARNIRVVMTRTDRGAQDGHTVEEFVEGEEYLVTEDLAKAFMSSGSCEIVPSGEEVGERSTKMKREPRNKSRG